MLNVENTEPNLYAYRCTLTPPIAPLLVKKECVAK